MKFGSPGNGYLVELQLVTSGEQYPEYRVLLQKLDSSESFAVPNLHASSAPPGTVVLVRVPADLLTRGTYQLQLFGVSAKGGDELVGGYDFQVIDNR
jgi:hypothetical protein